MHLCLVQDSRDALGFKVAKASRTSALLQNRTQGDRLAVDAAQPAQRRFHHVLAGGLTDCIFSCRSALVRDALGLQDVKSIAPEVATTKSRSNALLPGWFHLDARLPTKALASRLMHPSPRRVVSTA
jgi:hypothetical protein